MKKKQEKTAAVDITIRGDLSRLTLRDGEVLVLEVPKPLTGAQYEILRMDMLQALDIAGASVAAKRILILDGGARLRVVARDAAGAAPETKTCPDCGRLMIRISDGRCLTSYPTQYPMIWWCNCGHHENAGTDHDKTAERIQLERWAAVNAFRFRRFRCPVHGETERPDTGEPQKCQAPLFGGDNTQYGVCGREMERVEP